MRVHAESDPEVQKALDLLPQAKQLADNAKKTIAQRNNARLTAQQGDTPEPQSRQASNRGRQRCSATKALRKRASLVWFGDHAARESRLTGGAAHHRHEPPSMLGFVPPRSIKAALHHHGERPVLTKSSCTSGCTSRSKSAYANLINS